ncbi:MAG TPA: hypothetical protein VLE27_06795, partial [Thermoanaerobaculia bacterium]|nr:hypothetical protein [Thermoanaerobaculia bacterium]
MMQTLLASQREKNQDQKDDFLRVFLVGSQTRFLEELSDQPVRWTDVHEESWWNDKVPSDIGSRTNYIDAVNQAAALLDSLPKEAKKNLVLISDGELDLGETNRPSRGALQEEELSVYRNFLRTDNPAMRQLADNHVTIYTLALDEELASYTWQQRFKQIGQRLNEQRIGGASPLERGLSVVEDLAGKVDRDGRLSASEGPFVLRALADQFGGKARSVRYDNVLNVMWEMVFPDQERKRLVLPPGTNKVIISAPVDAPVEVKIWKDGKKETVSLRYDKELTTYRADPPEMGKELEEVNVRATSQYATWIIASSNLAEVDPGVEAEATEKFSILAINNARLYWQAGKPQEKILAGNAAELVIDLKRLAEPPGPSAAEWRQTLSQLPIRATAEVIPPDSDAQSVQLRSEILQEPADGVLRLTGRFTDTRSAGTYEVRVNLEAGPENEAWRIGSRSVRFQVVEESPLSTPGLFSLAVRLQKEGKLETSAVMIEPPEAGKPSPQVKLIAQPSNRLVFEWQVDPDQKCDGVNQLLLEVPEARFLLGASKNALADGVPVQEGDRLICYRSSPEPVEKLLNRPLTVKAGDGLASWERKLLLTPPEPQWKRILRWGALGLLALLAATALAFALIPGLRNWLLAAIARWRAEFPLAVDIAGGESRAWEKSDKVKRFLVSSDSQGDVEVEVTNRKLDSGEAGFDIRPNSADDYRIRLLSGSGWKFRKLTPSRQPSPYRLLGAEGEVVT